MKSELFSETLMTDKVFSDFIKFTEIIVGNISHEVGNNPNNKTYIKNTFSSFRNVYSGKLDNILSITMFSWVDRNKKVTVCSEVGVVANDKDVSDRDYIASTVTNPGHLYLGKPTIGIMSEQYIIPAGMGVVDKKNNYQGSVIIGFNIEKIYKKLLESRIKDNFEIQIIFAKNQTIVKQGFNVKAKYMDKIDLNNKEIQILSDFSLFSNRPLIIYKKIENQPYGVLLKLDNPNYLPFKFRANYIFEFAAILMVFGSFIYLIRKDFINPVLDLAEIARRISAGEKNVLIPTSNIKEINELEDALLGVKKSFEDKHEISERNVKENLSKSAFISSISHELRSSVAAISTAVDLMLAVKLSEEEVNGVLKDMQNYCEEHSKFIKDLLDVGQAESGNFGLGEVSEEDVLELINRSIKIVKGRAVKSEIKFVIDIEKDLPKLKCDLRRIKQVLVNLLTNAIKYSDCRTVVTISAKTLTDDGKKKIVLSVKDQGFGMSEKDIDKALRRYETVDNPNKNRVDSFGLGLPIIKHLVEIHNARLEIHSKEGVGSEFVIVFNGL